MAKYQSGNYLILTFDKYGTKVDSRLAKNQSLMAAQEEGADLIGGDVASYVVIRVLVNSIDLLSSQAWMPKQMQEWVTS